MLKTYKIEIKPTEEQKQKINKTIGICKFIYNFYISKNKEIYEQTKKFMSANDFSKWLNNNFIPNNPSYLWIKEVSSKAVKQSICNAENSFKRFFKKQSKFPKYKKKSDTSVKMYLPKNNNTDWTIERHRVKIPTLGFIRLKEFGYIPLNSVVKSGTVSKDADRYFVSILVEEEKSNIQHSKNQNGIGIDLGLKDFAICSNGETFKNINKTNKIKKLEKKLKREQRAFSRKLENNKKTKKKGGEKPANNSANINKNKLRIQILHRKLRNIRIEYVKFVVNSLVKANNLPEFISIEDLNVRGMMKNRHLSKAIQRQNFYYFRLFLEQQCKKYGVELRVINKFYPSSKLCSCCGQIKTDLKLSDRVYKCDCGNIIDRDYQASLNIRDCKIYKVAN